MSKRRAKLGASLENPPADEIRPAAPSANGESDIAQAQARDVESRIHEILNSELGRGAYIRLYRRKPMEADFGLLTGKLDIENFSIDWVLETYGGGEYMIKTYRQDHKMIRQMTWKNDPSIPIKGGPASDAPPAGSDAAGIIRAVREGQEKHQGGDKSELAIMFGEVMKANAALTQALATRGNGGNDSRLIELLLPKLLDRQERTPFDEMMRFYSSMERLKKGEMPDEKEPKSPIEAIAEKVLEAIMPVVAARFGPPQAPAVPAIPAAAAVRPAPVKSSQVPQSQPPENQEMQMLLDRFRSAVLKAATEKKDPFLWTESMLQFVPSEYHAQIFNFANSDDWLAKLFANANGDATKNFEYLQEVRGAILAIGFANASMQAKNNRTPPAAAEGWAKEFLAWACPSYREELGDMIRDDPEFMPYIFGEKFEENRLWIEDLAKAIDSQTRKPEPKPAEQG